MTIIQPLRKNGLGIQGTIRNAKHHAKAMLPFIRALQGPLARLGFAKWLMGHNLHVLETTDGRQFVLRGIKRDTGYVGVRLALRLSRSQEIHLLDIDHLDDVPTLLDTLELMAEGQKGKNSASLIEAA